MTRITSGDTVRNFHTDIRMDDYIVETDLFPVEALDAYTAWNLELDVPAELRAKYFSAHRGGNQGDYRAGMRAKLANVVACLTEFPASKRALISVVPRDDAPHTDDGAAKCMREVHFHLDHDVLNATVLFRSQAAEIFPKNIHFVGALMAEVAARLQPRARVGTLHYLATVLVSDRA
jgi:thymidylate synthase